MAAMIEVKVVGERTTTLYLNADAIESIRSVEGVPGVKVKMRSGENWMLEGTAKDIIDKMAGRSR